jgi:hypothetical protein
MSILEVEMEMTVIKFLKTIKFYKILRTSNTFHQFPDLLQSVSYSFAKHYFINSLDIDAQIRY